MEEKMVVNEKGGMKLDGVKLRFDLIDPEMMRALAKVLTDGSIEYDDYNWRDVEPVRYIAALMRHLNSWLLGETIDPKSGEHPLAHLIANASFLMWFDRQDSCIDSSFDEFMDELEDDEKPAKKLSGDKFDVLAAEKIEEALFGEDTFEQYPETGTVEDWVSKPTPAELAEFEDIEEIIYKKYSDKKSDPIDHEYGKVTGTGHFDKDGIAHPSSKDMVINCSGSGAMGTDSPKTHLELVEDIADNISEKSWQYKMGYGMFKGDEDLMHEACIEMEEEKKEEAPALDFSLEKVTVPNTENMTYFSATQAAFNGQKVARKIWGNLNIHIEQLKDSKRVLVFKDTSLGTSRKWSASSSDQSATDWYVVC